MTQNIPPAADSQKTRQFIHFRELFLQSCLGRRLLSRQRLTEEKLARNALALAWHSRLQVELDTPALDGYGRIWATVDQRRQIVYDAEREFLQLTDEERQLFQVPSCVVEPRGVSAAC